MHVAHLTTLSIGLSTMTPVGLGAATPEALIARMREMVRPEAPVVQVMNEEARFDGVIRRIDEEAGTVTLVNTAGETTTVSYDDDTTYTLNGEDSTRALALAVGRDASVVHKDGRAVSFEVTQGGE